MNLAVVVVAGGYDPSPDHIAKLVDLARPGKHDSSALTASAAALAIATRSASPAWQRLKCLTGPPNLPETAQCFAAGGPRHRNCNVHLDKLDWDRPVL